jgi:hypothetical protein
MDDVLRAEAMARHELHQSHPSHRPLSEDYELIGLCGEAALAQMFGLSVDMVRRPGGDGGVDNVLRLRTATGPQEFKVDVKTARKPNNLIVEVGKLKPATIYVLAGYAPLAGKATLLGWEWGRVLHKAPSKDFGYGVINHYIPRVRLRALAELLERHDSDCFT